MTRRAPPLEIISRHSTTEPSVHRPYGRWTGLARITAPLRRARRLPRPPRNEVRAHVAAVAFAHAPRPRRPERHGEPRGQRAPDARARRLPATPRCSTITWPPCATSARRRCSPATCGTAHRWPAHLSRHVCGHRPGARATSWSRASFSKKPSRAIEPEPLLAAAAARGVKIYVLYDAVGSLTTDAEIPRWPGQAGHLAVRLQSAESARRPLLRREPARPSQDRRGRRRARLRGRRQFQPGLSHRVEPGTAARLSKQKSLEEGWRDTHIGLRVASDAVGGDEHFATDGLKVDLRKQEGQLDHTLDDAPLPDRSRVETGKSCEPAGPLVRVTSAQQPHSGPLVH